MKDYKQVLSKLREGDKARKALKTYFHPQKRAEQDKSLALTLLLFLLLCLYFLTSYILYAEYSKNRVKTINHISYPTTHTTYNITQVKERIVAGSREECIELYDVENKKRYLRCET